MSSILNGIRWTEKRLTDEQLLLLEDAEKRSLGCLKCEGINEISNGDFTLGINEDELSIDYEFSGQGVRVGDCIEVQISYCPFCGKKL